MNRIEELHSEICNDNFFKEEGDAPAAHAAVTVDIAIRFAEWIAKSKYWHYHEPSNTWLGDLRESLTTEQLFSEFQKTI